jgi:hypothetical protein
MFFSGSIEEGVALAQQAQKAIACFVTGKASPVMYDRGVLTVCRRERGKPALGRGFPGG